MAPIAKKPRNLPLKGKLRNKHTPEVSDVKAKAFAANLIKHAGNKTAAAKATGIGPKAAHSSGSKLAKNAKVKTELGKLLAKDALTAERVIEEARRIAFADVGVLFDEAGDLRPMHELTEAQRAAISSLEVIIKNAKAGDGITDTIHKLKLWDKVRALEMLMKHFGLLTERSDVHVTVTMTEEVAAARARAVAFKARRG